MNFRDEFIRYMRNNNVAGVKQLVTRENVFDEGLLMGGGGGVLLYLCIHGPDEPDLLRHFVSVAGPQRDRLFEHGSKQYLHLTIFYERPNLARELVSIGYPINMKNDVGHTALEYSLDWSNECRKKIAIMLLDAGADVTLLSKHIQAGNTLLREYIARKETVNAAVIVVLGLRRCRSAIVHGSDVLRIIARCVKATQGTHKKKWDRTADEITNWRMMRSLAFTNRLTVSGSSTNSNSRNRNK